MIDDVDHHRGRADLRRDTHRHLRQVLRAGVMGLLQQVPQ